MKCLIKKEITDLKKDQYKKSINIKVYYLLIFFVFDFTAKATSQDVIICGAISAGIFAAISAARQGNTWMNYSITILNRKNSGQSIRRIVNRQTSFCKESCDEKAFYI